MCCSYLLNWFALDNVLTPIGCCADFLGESKSIFANPPPEADDENLLPGLGYSNVLNIF